MGIVLFILVVIFIIAFFSHKEKTYVPNPDKKQKKNIKDDYMYGAAGNEISHPTEYMMFEDNK